MRKSIISVSSLQTRGIAKTLAKELLEAQPRKGAYVFALAGELGSGKTTFAQGFAKGLGVKERILSPTFIIMKKFTLSSDRVPSRMTGQNPKFQNFYHIDCYRLDNPAKELLHLGFKNIIADPHNIVVVEWADRVKNVIPQNALWLFFSHAKNGGTSRVINFNAT